MPILRKAPNGELIKFPDGTSEEEIQKKLYSDQYKNQNEGILNDIPEGLKNNWAFDNLVVAPYEGSRKAINSATSLVEQLGDTLGEKTNVGGFRYGSDADNNLVEYVPYDRAVKELQEDGKKTYGVLSPVTGAIGIKDAFNTQGFFYDPNNPDNNDHTQTLSADLIEGVTQFVIGFKGVDKAYKGAKLAQASTKAGAFAQASAKGAVADFTVFDPQEGRFTDMLYNYAPETVDSYFGYLKSDPTDTWYEGRFKNALEGLGLGALTEVIFRGARLTKNFGKDKKAKEIKEDEEYLTKTNKVLDEVSDQMNEATTVSEKMKILNDALDAGDLKGFKVQKKITPTQQIKIINDVVKKNLKTNFDKWQRGEINSEEAFNIDEGFINLETFKGDLSFEGLKTFKSFYDAVSKVNKSLNKTVTDEAVRRKAVNDYGGDVNKVFQDFSKFADNVQNTESLIFAHEVAYTSLLNAFPKFIRQYKGGKRTKGDMQMFMFMLENMTVNSKRVRSASGRNLRIYKLSKEEFSKGKEIETEFLNAKNAYNNFGGGEKAFNDFLDRMSRADNPTTARKVLNFALTNRIWNVANEVWINALLSSPKTQLVNALSNGVLGLTRPIEDAMGNKISELISKDAEQAVVYKRNFDESLERYSGMVEYFSQSLKFAGIALKNGELILQSKDAGSTKLDTSSNKTVKGIKGEVVRLPSRFLNATDEFFKQINYKSKLKAQAIREARVAGLKKEKDIRKFVDEYIKLGYDESGLRGINEEALRYAEENTFTNELVGLSDKFSDLVNSNPFLKQFFPFVKTPMNIAKAVVDRTPIAGLTYNAKHVFGRSGDPVMIAKARGQLAMGIIVLTNAYLLAKSGKISGATGYVGEKSLDRYKDAELIRMKKSATGFKPYSIKIGNKQYPFGQLDPFGALLGLVVDFMNEYDRLSEEEIERFGADMLMSTMSLDAFQKAEITTSAFINSARRNIFSKTYLRGLVDLLDAINSEDERTLERYFSNKVASYVPNVWRKVVNDPYYRDAVSIGEAFRTNLGFGTPASPRYNALGEAHKDPDSFATRFFRNAVNPLASTELRKDAIASELLRLGKGLPNVPKAHEGLELQNFKSGKVSAWDKVNQLMSNVVINGKTLREKLEEEIQSQSYQNKSDPIVIGKGMTDDGDKVRKLKYIHSEYLNKAFNEFSKISDDYKLDKNKKLSFKQAVKNNKKNRSEIRVRDNKNSNLQLQPILNFGN